MESSAALGTFRCTSQRQPGRSCSTRNARPEKRQREQCRIKNEASEGGNCDQAGLPLRTCPLRREILVESPNISRRIQYRQMPARLQAAGETRSLTVSSNDSDNLAREMVSPSTLGLMWVAPGSLPPAQPAMTRRSIEYERKPSF